MGAVAGVTLLHRSGVFEDFHSKLHMHCSVFWVTECVVVVLYLSLVGAARYLIMCHG